MVIPYGKNEGIVKSFTSWGLRSNPQRVEDFRSLQFFPCGNFQLNTLFRENLSKMVNCTTKQPTFGIFAKKGNFRAKQPIFRILPKMGNFQAKHSIFEIFAQNGKFSSLTLYFWDFYGKFLI